MALNAQTEALNAAMQAARATAPPPTPESVREAYERLISLTAAPAPASRVEEVDVAGCPSLLVTPPEVDDGLLVWFHGGGFVLNSPQLSLTEVDRLAVAARCRCVSVGYRLSPEHPLPAAQHDAIAAATEAIDRAPALGADPRKVAVGGDSAGGNLAAVAAQRVAGLCAQLLVYPAVDLRDVPLEDRPHAEGYALDAATMDFFTSQALRGGVDPADPLVSPLLASPAVLAATPPALVVTCEYDPIRDDGRRYAAALRAAGVRVEELRYDDEMHLFFSLPEILDGAKRAIAEAGEFLATAFASV